LGVVDQMIERFVTSLAVEHAVEQVDVTLFIAEEMIKLEPPKVAVLQRRQLLEKDDRIGITIAVKQGETALRLGTQRRLDQRHDRRDPGPPGKGDIMMYIGGIELDSERTMRRHHVQRV